MPKIDWGMVLTVVIAVLIAEKIKSIPTVRDLLT